MKLGYLCYKHNGEILFFGIYPLNPENYFAVVRIAYTSLTDGLLTIKSNNPGEQDETYR